MEPVILTTARLELSPPTEADIDAITAACQDPAIARYIPIPSPYARRDAEEFVTKVAQWWESGTDPVWAIRAGGAFCGVVGLHRISGGSGEIGYWLAPEARGLGYLTEAARAVIDFGFGEPLSLSRIEWRAVVGNVSSARAARALGFRFEGVLRQALVSPRTRDDGWIAGLLPIDDRAPQHWPVLED